MRRRALLTSLAAASAGLAGCAFADGGDPDRTGDRTTEPTADAPGDPTATATPEGDASVVALETTPRTCAFAPTTLRTNDEATVALWFDRTATADHPARLRGWLRNDNPFPNTFRTEWLPAVGRVHARQPGGYDHEAGLHLAPTGNNGLAGTVPELARTDEGLWYARSVGP